MSLDDFRAAREKAVKYGSSRHVETMISMLADYLARREILDAPLGSLNFDIANAAEREAMVNTLALTIIAEASRTQEESVTATLEGLTQEDALYIYHTLRHRVLEDRPPPGPGREYRLHVLAATDDPEDPLQKAKRLFAEVRARRALEEAEQA